MVHLVPMQFVAATEYYHANYHLAWFSIPCRKWVYDDRRDGQSVGLCRALMWFVDQIKC
jgi:hypothetical protein